MKKKILSLITVVIIAVALCTLLVACLPKNPADAKANLQSHNYNDVVEIKNTGSLINGLVLPNGAESLITATKILEKEVIVLFYFEDTAAAKTFYKNDIEKYKEKYLENMTEEEKANIKIARSGKIVYIGTKGAIDAASKKK